MSEPQVAQRCESVVEEREETVEETAQESKTPRIKRRS